MAAEDKFSAIAHHLEVINEHLASLHRLVAPPYQIEIKRVVSSEEK